MRPRVKRTVSPDPKERIEQIEQALEEDQVQLATGSSVESIRSNSGSGLATLPYLTINDIVVLRDAGITEFEDIQNNILTLPDSAWPHVLDLVRARVLDPSPNDLRAQLDDA